MLEACAGFVMRSYLLVVVAEGAFFWGAVVAGFTDAGLGLLATTGTACALAGALTGALIAAGMGALMAALFIAGAGVACVGVAVGTLPLTIRCC